MKSTHEFTKKMKNNVLSYGLALSFGLFAGVAHADDCDFATGQGPLVYTIPLTTPNITVGADTPVDTIAKRFSPLIITDLRRVCILWTACTVTYRGTPQGEEGAESFDCM